MFLHDSDGDDHGVRRANTAQAHSPHAQWRHLVALHKATNTLHQAVCLASYLPGVMVIAIAVDFVTCYYIVDNN